MKSLENKEKNTESLGARKSSVQKDLGFLFHLYQGAQTFWQGCPHKQGSKNGKGFPKSNVNNTLQGNQPTPRGSDTTTKNKGNSTFIVRGSPPPPPPRVLGDIHKQSNIWEQLTSDKLILSIVKEGITIDFHTLPRCSCVHPICHLNPTQQEAVTSEVQHLLSLGVISETSYTPDRYISSVFTTEKRDHSLRMILNLKKLNEFVNYVHFKMESLNDVLCLIQPGVWMGSVDLQDAYYRCG